jgi:1-acyl-sn-glycerol-3-phosphate acyltransferase
MSRKSLGPRPTPLPWHERALNLCLRAPAILGFTAIFGSFSMLASLVEKDGKWQHSIAQRWARVLVRASGARLHILHPERLKPQLAVYTCNHLSYMDTPVLFGSLPFQFRIVARHDLWKLPFIGWHLRRSGQVPVNVDNPRASIASLSSAVKTLKAGMPLVIFPEGGRSRDGHLAPFLNGPAFMAIRAQVPIVPMALIGTHELLPIHAGELHPVPVTLAVGEPIPTTGLTMKEVDSLTQQLMDAIANLYYQHSYLSRPAEESDAALEAGLASSSLPL